MPIYKADITIEVDGDDIDWLWDVINQFDKIDGVKITEVAQWSDNPEQYPEEV